MIYLWFVLDTLLKFGLGIVLALLVWLPFRIFADAPFGQPWLIGGLVLGLLINGFFELCDIFGLKRLLGIRD